MNESKKKIGIFIYIGHFKSRKRLDATYYTKYKERRLFPQSDLY